MAVDSLRQKPNSAYVRMRSRLIAAGVIGLLLAVSTLADDARDRRRTPVVDVFERCRDAVVNVSTERVVGVGGRGGSPLDDFFDFSPRRREAKVPFSVGSGAIIHPDGYIVTNAHVVARSSEVHVTFADQSSLPAEVIAVDSEHDLAVLKVDAPKRLAVLRLGEPDDVMIGETVIAIGNPLGLQHTVTTGIISAANRDLEVASNTVYKGLLQTDAPINPGNSGGPLLNINGDLIGINTAIRADAQNIGFSIPVAHLWRLLPDVLDIERRERVRFGLVVRGRDSKVIEVHPGTPAAAAGLKAGDRIIKFNGTPVTDAIDYYLHLINSKPADTIRLVAKRGEQTLDLPVKLESIPLPDGQTLAKQLFGMKLGLVPDDVRKKYELPRSWRLVVVDVDEGSPAAAARIEAGDFILGLGRVTVRSLDDVQAALADARKGDVVPIEGITLTERGPLRWRARPTVGR